MAGKKKAGVMDALMRAFKAKDAEEVEQIAEEMKDDLGGLESGDKEVHIHINGNGAAPASDEELGDPKPVMDDGMEERFAALEAGHEELKAGHAEILAKLEELMGMERSEQGMDEMPEEALEQALKDEAPEGLEEQAASAKDSAYLRDSFRDTMAIAEILSPGIKAPTYDRASDPKSTFKAICGLRRQALDKAYQDADTRVMIDTVLAGRTLDTKNMTCDAVRTVFRAAGALKKASTQSRVSGSGTARDAETAPQKKAVTSIAELNAKLRTKYADL